jgi:hypothetical protein
MREGALMEEKESIKTRKLHNGLTKIKKEVAACGVSFCIVSEPVLQEGSKTIDPDEFFFELSVTRDELINMISTDSVLPGTVLKNEKGELFEAVYFDGDPENFVTLKVL